MRTRFALPLLVALMATGAWAQASAAPPSKGSVRVWREYVTAPAQFDLSLAEITFGAPARVASAAARPPHATSQVRLALVGTAGLNYVAGAVTRFTMRGRPRVLVLVINRRPRGSLAPDLARIGLKVTAPRRLGSASLVQVSNPFTRRATGLTPALCDLQIRGPALKASDLRSALSPGPAFAVPVAGAPVRFGAEAAVAQAYDAACGRPYDPLFRKAVTQGSGAGCEGGQASIVSCCPPNAMCVPPPCPPCPCGPGPCPLAGAPGRTALACPLQSQAIACPMQRP